VKCACRILLVSLLCSCTGPTGPGEGGKTAESVPVRFLNRSSPLVEYTFEIMEMRADRSQMRERFRAEGKRVCEEGETGTTWKEDCNDCRCDWGIRHCLNRPCQSPETVARLRAEAQDYNRRKAERDRKVREQDRVRGVRVCEEGENGTIWKEDPYTCWCESGMRYCSKSESPPPARVRVCEEGKDWTTWKEDPYTCWCESGIRWCSEHGRPKPPDPEEEEEFTVEPPPDTFEYNGSRCTEEEIGTYWQWGCNTCWCEAGFRVCSKADCPSSHPKGAAATDDTE
jgi:hypothetical protein